MLHVLYASETGNGEELVERVAPPAARAAGIGVRVREIDAVSLEELAQMRWALFVVSTTGQGDVPYDAEELWDALIAADAPELDQLRFGVLALGDRVYADFCQAGIEFDDRLAELGAQRLVELVTCDYDYETPASRWLREGIDAVARDMAEAAGGADAGEPTSAEPGPSGPGSAPAGPQDTEPEPLRIPDPAARTDGTAIVEDVRVLTDRDPDREILHCTLALPPALVAAGPDGDGPPWQVGDSLDLLEPNDPRLVAAVLDRLRIDPDQVVEDGTTSITAARLLTERLELRQLPRSLVEAIQERTGDDALGRLLAGRATNFERWRWGRDLLSVLEEAPQLQADAEDLARWLRPLQTRAYSIASSPRTDAGRVDLTVRTLRYERDGRTLEGTASGALSRLARGAGDHPDGNPSLEVLVRHRPAPGFRLPDDPSADLVMIGPGVGVAPFRGYLQERSARGDSGRSWLLCGIRERTTDLLYARELEAWRDDGVLTRLDVAESRAADGAEYVQHTMDRLGPELFAWIDAGAHLHVCGDAREMAPAVRLALRAVGSRELGSPERGAAWVARLQAEHRYREDVY
ncbi:sulfite reductase flavoprotein subunit alpha [Brachybacterium sp. ACRRE]|uniref:diflavin oxidoreductase n=1 Tax=Brachybacterium sp. ACRRE TaxID=2918184 RepID=UPI001EF3400D|nr:sulfite reductase flavoprotein subunit alpha [Brachybacterium sp. ACRRE]